MNRFKPDVRMEHLTDPQRRLLKTCSKVGHRPKGAEKRVAADLCRRKLMTFSPEGIIHATQAGLQNLEWAENPTAAMRHASQSLADIIRPLGGIYPGKSQ